MMADKGTSSQLIIELAPGEQLLDVPSVCRGCKGNVVKDIVRCPKCSSPYHPSCAEKAGVASDGSFRKCCNPRKGSPGRDGFSLDELMTAMRSVFDPQLAAIDAKVSETQESIKTIGARVTIVEDDIKRIFHRVFDAEESIKGVHNDLAEFKACGGTSSSNTSNIAECIREMEDRKRRKKNIILLGIDEINDKNIQSRVKHDHDKVNELFTAISFIYSPPVDQPLKTSRIGKFSPNLPKPRPLLVTLDKFQSVVSVTQAFTRLKRSSQPPPLLASLKITSDKTLMQRTEYKTLVMEMISRTQKGEAGLKIVTKSGSASIARVSGTTTNRPTTGQSPREPT